jgi:hypothetical protein
MTPHHMEAGAELFLSLMAVVLEIEKVVADLRLGEQSRELAVVGGQLPHGADVGFLGAFAAACELKILDHPLAERGRGARSDHRETLSQRKKNNPCERR